MLSTFVPEAWWLQCVGVVQPLSSFSKATWRSWSSIHVACSTIRRSAVIDAPVFKELGNRLRTGRCRICLWVTVYQGLVISFSKLIIISGTYLRIPKTKRAGSKGYDSSWYSKVGVGNDNYLEVFDRANNPPQYERDFDNYLRFCNALFAIYYLFRSWHTWIPIIMESFCYLYLLVWGYFGASLPF